MISWFVTGWISIRNELALTCTCVRNERILRGPNGGTAVTCTSTIVISVASFEYGVPLTTMNEKAKGKQQHKHVPFWWRLSQ